MTTTAQDWYDRHFSWAKPLGKALAFLLVCATVCFGGIQAAAYIAAREFVTAAQLEAKLNIQDIQQQQRLVAATEAINIQLKQMNATQQTMLQVLLEGKR